MPSPSVSGGGWGQSTIIPSRPPSRPPPNCCGPQLTVATPKNDTKKTVIWRTFKLTSSFGGMLPCKAVRRFVRKLIRITAWALGIFWVAYSGTYVVLNDARLGGFISARVNKVERGNFHLGWVHYN